MIWVHGREWGRAQDIAEALGEDITVDCVREWGKSRRGRPAKVTAVKMPGTGEVWYPMDECLRAEALTHAEPRGRPRKLTARPGPVTVSPVRASAGGMQ